MLGALGALVYLYHDFAIKWPERNFQAKWKPTPAEACQDDGTNKPLEVSYIKAYLAKFTTGGCEEADALLNTLLLTFTLVALYWMLQHLIMDRQMSKHHMAIGGPRLLVTVVLMASIALNSVVVLPTKPYLGLGVYVALMVIWLWWKDKGRYSLTDNELKQVNVSTTTGSTKGKIRAMKREDLLTNYKKEFQNAKFSESDSTAAVKMSRRKAMLYRYEILSGSAARNIIAKNRMASWMSQYRLVDKVVAPIWYKFLWTGVPSSVRPRILIGLLMVGLVTLSMEQKKNEKKQSSITATQAVVGGFGGLLVILAVVDGLRCGGWSIQQDAKRYKTVFGTAWEPAEQINAMLAFEVQQLGTNKITQCKQFYEAYDKTSWKWWNGAWVNFWRLVLVSGTFHFVALHITSTAKNRLSSPGKCNDNDAESQPAVPDECAFYTQIERFNLRNSLAITLVLFLALLIGGSFKNKFGELCKDTIDTEDVPAYGEWFTIFGSWPTWKAILLYIVVFAGIAHGGAVEVTMAPQLLTQLRDSAIHWSFFENADALAQQGTLTPKQQDKDKSLEQESSVVTWAMANDLWANLIMMILLIGVVGWARKHMWGETPTSVCEENVTGGVRPDKLEEHVKHMLQPMHSEDILDKIIV